MRAPACTAASELATASSASLWTWMPIGTPGNRAATAAVISATSEVSRPPLVSHGTSASAPASAAAASVRIAYSGSSR